jgi:hypothetical protein
MSEHNSEEVRFEATLVVDAFILRDIAWLLASIKEFARTGDPASVEEFLEYVNPHLSADGLANIASALDGDVRQRLQEVR